MKNILFIILFFISACSTQNDGILSDKPLTQNIPSTDKFIKAGKRLDSIHVFSTESVINSGTTFDVIERLYDTVWYQTEKEYDDGRLETETEFVFFNNQSWVVEREM
ncbi:MAG: hypothetical protein ACRCV0_03905 [Brevinema sp.]